VREATLVVPKLDQVATGVLILLLIASPIAFGAVHPLSYRPMEAVLFGLAMIWMAKTAQVARSTNHFDLPPARVFVAGKLALPIVAFTAFALLQLVPLPPPVIRALSPKTYELYTKVLEDWPYAAPYEHIGPSARDNRGQRTDEGPVILPTRDEVNRGDPIPFEPRTAGAGARSQDEADKSGSSVSKTVAAIYGTRWRSIAIAPVLAWSSLLALLACASAFLVTAYYPFNDREISRTEFRFPRRILRVVLAMGFMVALIGLIEQATWNGKLLWFFIPYDWGHPLMDATRTRAPFVDPDHFAGYLAIIFPLALSSTWYPSIVTASRPSLTMRIVCAVASFVIFVAMLLSLSRAGWMSIVLGPAIMFMLVTSTRRAKDDQVSLQARRGGLRLAMGTLAIGLALTLVVVGPDARTATTERFHSSLAETDTFSGRIGAWRGGAQIVRDFPIVGIGLGDWPEIFARYQPPPWTELFFSEAHNDYIQWTAETGLFGAAFLLWFAWAAIGELTSRRLSLAPLAVPAFAAIVGGLVSMCVIEVFDFDLRIPALAFLFAVMLGLAIRLASASGGAANANRIRPGAARALAFCSSVAAIILVVGSLAQSGIIYPRNLVMPHSADDARGLLLAYPANSMSHISLVKFEGDTASPARRNAELERALWLEPLDPQISDEYVRTLILAGRKNDALKQLRLSVLNSPGIEIHQYLTPRMVDWLTPAAQRAVEDGLREAVRRKYLHAPDVLGDYYSSIGRFRDEAGMFAQVAEEQSDPNERAYYLLKSGDGYARMGDTASALVDFRAAAEAAPDNSQIYSDMLTMVFAPRHDLNGAEKAVEKGIADGADPQILSVALADVAVRNGDRATAEAALEQAVQDAPDSYQTLIELAQIYAQDGKVDRAVLTYQKAIDIKPDSPDAYFQLAGVEESSYRYYAAEQAYKRAAELGPSKAQYQKGLVDFQRKLKAAADVSPVTSP
jgi:O-antigen ligase/tetratricopeptide (TPR) repeat protein